MSHVVGSASIRGEDPVFTEGIGVAKGIAGITAVQQEHRVLSFIVVTQFIDAYKADIYVRGSRCGMPEESHQTSPRVDFLRNVDHFNHLVGAFSDGLDRSSKINILGNVFEAVEEIKKALQFKGRSAAAKMDDILLPIFLN